MSRPHSLFGDERLREVAVPATMLWRSPDSPRDVDAPAVRERPDPAGWANALDQDRRLGLHGLVESQLLLGDPVLVEEERDGWSRVQALWQASSQGEQGYPGWVPSAHLATPVPLLDGPTAWVDRRTATCRTDGGDLELSLGTALWVDRTADDEVRVHLPGARSGVLARSDVRLSHKQEQPSYDASDVLDRARTFLGLQYLWGGTSTWGVDCSGLVHLTYRSFGTALPRDAHDQAAFVDPVPLDEVRAGDLYFFARPGESVYHVGFVSRPVQDDGTRWMLHAPEAGSPFVEDAPLAPHRAETLVSAGRVATDGSQKGIETNGES